MGLPMFVSSTSHALLFGRFNERDVEVCIDAPVSWFIVILSLPWGCCVPRVQRAVPLSHDFHQKQRLYHYPLILCAYHSIFKFLRRRCRHITREIIEMMLLSAIGNDRHACPTKIMNLSCICHPDEKVQRQAATINPPLIAAPCDRLGGLS